MEPMNVVLTIVFGILMTAARAAFGWWQNHGEPLDPKKLQKTLLIGFLVSLILQLSALGGWPIMPDVAQPFATAIVTTFIQSGEAGWKKRKAAVPTVVTETPTVTEVPAPAEEKKT